MQETLSLLTGPHSRGSHVRLAVSEHGLGQPDAHGLEGVALGLVDLQIDDRACKLTVQAKATRTGYCLLDHSKGYSLSLGLREIRGMSTFTLVSMMVQTIT